MEIGQRMALGRGTFKQSARLLVIGAQDIALRVKAAQAHRAIDMAVLAGEFVIRRRGLAAAPHAASFLVDDADAKSRLRVALLRFGQQLLQRALTGLVRFGKFRRLAALPAARADTQHAA